MAYCLCVCQRRRGPLGAEPSTECPVNQAWSAALPFQGVPGPIVVRTIIATAIEVQIISERLIDSDRNQLAILCISLEICPVAWCRRSAQR